MQNNPTSSGTTSTASHPFDMQCVSETRDVASKSREAFASHDQFITTIDGLHTNPPTILCQIVQISP